MKINIPCDHEYYGNIGCGGNCDSSKYKEINNILCEENKCKEGYYNLEGICVQCSIGSEYCSKCTYLVPYKDSSKEFKCNECINDKYQVLDDGRCHQCFINNCLDCHYPYLSKTPICDKCDNGYYINSNGTCSKCHYPIHINNGLCKVCSDNLNNFESGYCSCDLGYTLFNYSSCISCPENCEICIYNQTLKYLECKTCKYGYFLNSKNKCVTCGDNCNSCELDTEKNPICKSCFSGYMLTEDNKCSIKCSENCSHCQIDEKGQIECIDCYNFYGLNLQKQCIKCPNDCYTCHYRNATKDFGCSYCRSEDYRYTYWNSNYTIDKDEKCILCKNINEIGGNGCISCLYNKTSNKYSCNMCLKNDTYEYIMILNDKICKLPKDLGLSDYCEEGINLGTLKNPKYSCNKCKNYTTIVTNKNGINNCFKRKII